MFACPWNVVERMELVRWGNVLRGNIGARSERRLVYLIVIPGGVLWGDVTVGWELGGGRMSLGDDEWLEMEKDNACKRVWRSGATWNGGGRVSE
jgi:hypothetical protein